jgi:hypothetical protein
LILRQDKPCRAAAGARVQNDKIIADAVHFHKIKFHDADIRRFIAFGKG